MEIKSLFEKVLQRKLRIKRTPVFVIKLLTKLLKIFNPAGANLLQLNYLGATESSFVDSKRLAAEFGIQLTTAEDYLRSII